MIQYPKYAEINGQRYPINTDFRAGLRCFEVINDKTISDNERALAVIYILFGFVPEKDADLFLEKAQIYLQCGKSTKEQNETNRDMDLTEDAPYIMASFMSDYRIDLNTADLHFWQYIDLIQGLTEHSVLSKVRELRNYDISDIKDAKTRNKIIRAKEAVALPIRRTKEEEEAIAEFEALLGG